MIFNSEIRFPIRYSLIDLFILIQQRSLVRI